MADPQLAALLAQQAAILDGVQKTLGRLEERDKDAASSLIAVNDRITADIAADKLERDATLASMKESFEAMKKSLEEVSNRSPPGAEEAKESPSTPSDITDFSTFHKGKLSKADQDHFSTSYGELSKGIGMNNLYHDTGLKIFTAVYNGKGTMENIGDLRKCISRYIEVHSLNKARRILDVKSYYSYTQGHDKFTDWINSSLVNAYSSAMNAIIGMKIDVTQLSGLQILRIDDVQLDESSARGEQVILWDKVPIDLFTKEKFLKDPFKYITEEGFKLKDQKFVISKILKHDKDLEMKTLSFHCIPMNFGDRTNEHQPYRNCLFKAGMNQSAEDRRYAPMSSMIPGDVNFNPAEHMDLTDFGSSDTVVSENLYAYLNNSFRNLSQKDKSELLSAEMENIRKISMGCKSYTLVQWVLSVLCGGQESILLHLQDYRKDVLDATTGAFSEFPLLDPNNIMKFVYQLNEKIGVMSNRDPYAYRSKKELMREVIQAMWRHVTASQWQNYSDEPASALHEKIFKITDALRVFYGNSHHRDKPSSLKALEATQVGLSHAIYDIKLMIDMWKNWNLMRPRQPSLPIV
ncbi:hypothetical protein AURANDRAFT_67389 [Aureococcus anophagefferens]|uniref:Uncharacterized protein n=1 Tax=Aureococcus anophagefferens TaxID=44056 RepID=F0YKZ4_AURAN|nr:hypothetical protein AURANDRAFT_67389 [Aureococcus anophagefferens]EGB04236.1 hypothetical protein AURANDRAFT_67389 [Aureococcus anophagefferens]|eukprot:XP_009041087.1 hypothetical protein AURANDRAFT_67389 [Aureococcus anophagefferens]